MKKVCIITFVTVVLIVTMLYIIAPQMPSQYMEKIVGTWVIYEGGNVAPDVLSFCGDGTGQAYTLSDDFPEQNQTPVYITNDYLIDPRPFSWDLQKGNDSLEHLNITFDDGVYRRYRLSIGPDSNGWIFLSLHYDIGGGGWIPAQIVR